MKNKLTKEDMHSILNDVFGERNINLEYYKRYDEDRVRFKIKKYSKKLRKKYTVGFVTNFLIGTIYLDDWEMTFNAMDQKEFTFRVEPGSERDYIEMVRDLMNEFYEIKEKFNEIYDKYCDIKSQSSLELREWKLNKLLNGSGN